jgi:PEP-CTERM motif
LEEDMKRATIATLAVLALLAFGVPAQADSITESVNDILLFAEPNGFPQQFNAQIFPDGSVLFIFPCFPVNCGIGIAGSFLQSISETSFGTPNFTLLIWNSGMSLSSPCTGMEESICSGTVNLGDGISGAGTVNIIKGIGYMTIDSLTIAEPVPEPGTLLSLGAGMFGLAFCRRRFLRDW